MVEVQSCEGQVVRGNRMEDEDLECGDTEHEVASHEGILSEQFDLLILRSIHDYRLSHHHVDNMVHGAEGIHGSSSADGVGIDYYSELVTRDMEGCHDENGPVEQVGALLLVDNFFGFDEEETSMMVGKEDDDYCMGVLDGSLLLVRVHFDDYFPNPPC